MEEKETFEPGKEKGEAADYSLPGVLFYLQQEWRNFEKERNNWALEKALLQTKIVQMEGEKIASQNFNNDLLKRIKMLEFALKQERSRYVSSAAGQLSGTNQLPGASQTGSRELRDKSSTITITIPRGQTNGRTGGFKNKSKDILQRYLSEMSNTDSIIFTKDYAFETNYPTISRNTVVSREPMRTRSNDKIHQNIVPTTDMTEDISKEYDPFGTIKGKNPTKQTPQTIKEEEPEEKDVIMDQEEKKEEEKEKEEKKEENEEEKEKENDTKETQPKNQSNENDVKMEEIEQDDSEIIDIDKSEEQDKNSDELSAQELEEKKLEEELAAKYNVSSSKFGRMMKGYDKPHKSKGKDKTKSKIPNFEEVKPNLGFDELENLKIEEHEEKVGSKVSDLAIQSEHKHYKQKHNLKNHMDGVKAVAFRENDTVLLSASEDGTIKAWNVGNLPTSKKQPDPTPFFTFRGHQSAVLSLAISDKPSHTSQNDQNNGECLFYSGGQDGTIRQWRLMKSNYDIFTPYNQKYSNEVIAKNLDCVWSLKIHPLKKLLASASADSKVRIWSLDSKQTLLVLEQDEPENPTSIDFVYNDLKKMAVSYANSNAHLYDLETGKSILSLQSNETYSNPASSQINSIVSHPTLPLVITGHEDKFLRFFDTNSGKCVNSMIAHMDSVSCLAMHPDGLSVVSGGHDSSVRIWDVSTYACLQDFTSHRKKLDESLFSVAFQNSSSMFASAGADATIKIYM